MLGKLQTYKLQPTKFYEKGLRCLGGVFQSICFCKFDVWVMHVKKRHFKIMEYQQCSNLVKRLLHYLNTKMFVLGACLPHALCSCLTTDEKLAPPLTIASTLCVHWSSTRTRSRYSPQQLLPSTLAGAYFRSVSR